MKFEIERGCFEFIKKKKRRQLLMTFAMLLIGILMFIVGLFMNKFERSNLLTMLAILMVLPATKYFVGFIVVFPYKSVSRERYEHIKSLISDNTILFTDMVFTSPDKVMNLDFMIITDNQLIGLLGKKKQDIKYMENYLKETLTVNKIEGYAVKIFEDEKKFENCIPTKKFEKSDLQQKTFMTIRTLIV